MHGDHQDARRRVDNGSCNKSTQCTRPAQPSQKAAILPFRARSITPGTKAHRSLLCAHTVATGDSESPVLGRTRALPPAVLLQSVGGGKGTTTYHDLWVGFLRKNAKNRMRSVSPEKKPPINSKEPHRMSLAINIALFVTYPIDPRARLATVRPTRGAGRGHPRSKRAPEWKVITNRRSQEPAWSLASWCVRSFGSFLLSFLLKNVGRFVTPNSKKGGDFCRRSFVLSYEVSGCDATTAAMVSLRGLEVRASASSLVGKSAEFRAAQTGLGGRAIHPTSNGTSCFRNYYSYCENHI